MVAGPHSRPFHSFVTARSHLSRNLNSGTLFIFLSYVCPRREDSMKLKSALLIAVVGVTSFAGAQQVTGAGATFPYPIYSKWFSEYASQHPGVQINYKSIGSGGGIKQVTSGLVDFGATDGSMADQQLKEAPVTVKHLHTVL